MGKAIVLSENRGYFRHWANQFVAADPSNRETVLVNSREILRRPSAEQLMQYVNTYYGAAAEAAGRNGCIIVSLGHGASDDSDPTIGMVDLLPNRALRVQAEQLRYSGSEVEEGDIAVLSRAPRQGVCQRLLGQYDLNLETRRHSPPDDRLVDYIDCSGARAARPRQQFEAAFARIGALLRINNVREVVLLTCKVGSARIFVDRIATSWQVNILAYEKRVAANYDDERDNPYYVYLVGEERHRQRQQLPNRYGYRARPHTAYSDQ